MRLEMRSISKQFGLEHALRRVSLELRAGALHTILGSHGAGKSTLAALLGGAQRPSSGELRLDGHRYTPRHLREARAGGVALLPSTPLLPLDLTPEEALLLGFEPTRLGLLHRATRREAARRALASLRCDDIPLALPLRLLSENQRRRVALARALMGAPRLVVLDEPAPLPDYDYHSLLTRLRELATSGTTILLLTGSPHRARELGGPLSLLIEGALHPPMDELPPRFSFDHLNGPNALNSLNSPNDPKVLNHLPQRRVRPRIGPVVLAIHHAISADLHAPITLTVREGEIVGLAGAPCSGRGAVLRLIAGLDATLTGALHLDGRPITRASVARRQRLGIELATGADDSAATLFPERPVSDNLLLSRLGRSLHPGQGRPLGRWGFYPPQEATALALDWMEKLAIRPGSPSLPAEALSRVNRRKLALGRLLQSRARLLLLSHPAIHLDTAAQALVYGWLSEMAAEGRALLLSGPSPAALLSFCDTIAVLHQGRLIAHRPAVDWKLEELEAAVNHTPPRLPEPPPLFSDS